MAEYIAVAHEDEGRVGVFAAAGGDLRVAADAEELLILQHLRRRQVPHLLRVRRPEKDSQANFVVQETRTYAARACVASVSAPVL